jgi:hypothetical protein
VGLLHLSCPPLAINYTVQAYDFHDLNLTEIDQENWIFQRIYRWEFRYKRDALH